VLVTILDQGMTTAAECCKIKHMKKTILTLFLFAFAASAQLQFVDLTTVTTNRLTNTANIVITNALIPGIATNVSLFGQYQTWNTNNRVIGDTLPNAFTKINANSTWLSSAVRTNGNSGSGFIPISTNAYPGYFWGSNSAGGISAATATNIAAYQSMLATNGLTAGGGTASNAIANNYGAGTNISFFGKTLMNDSNLYFSANSEVPKTLSLYTITNLANGIIPTMTPSDTNKAFCSPDQYINFYAYKAFDYYTGSPWQSGGGSNVVYIGYNFPSVKKLGALVGFFYITGGGSTGGGTISVQVDGPNWRTVYSTHLTNGAPADSFPTLFNSTNNLVMFDSLSTTNIRVLFSTANYPRISGWFQVYEEAGNLIKSDTSTLRIISTNGVAINSAYAGTNMLRVSGNIDSTVGFSINGVPINNSSSDNLNGVVSGYYSNNFFSVVGTNMIKSISGSINAGGVVSGYLTNQSFSILGTNAIASIASSASSGKIKTLYGFGTNLTLYGFADAVTTNHETFILSGTTTHNGTYTWNGVNVFVNNTNSSPSYYIYPSEDVSGGVYYPYYSTNGFVMNYVNGDYPDGPFYSIGSDLTAGPWYSRATGLVDTNVIARWYLYTTNQVPGTAQFVNGGIIADGSITSTNGFSLPQLSSIPTNKVPVSDSARTNWLQINLNGSVYLVATNFASGGWLYSKQTASITTSP